MHRPGRAATTFANMLGIIALITIVIPISSISAHKGLQWTGVVSGILVLAIGAVQWGSEYRRSKRIFNWSAFASLLNGVCVIIAGAMTLAVLDERPNESDLRIVGFAFTLLACSVMAISELHNVFVRNNELNDPYPSMGEHTVSKISKWKSYYYLACMSLVALVSTWLFAVKDNIEVPAIVASIFALALGFLAIVFGLAEAAGNFSQKER